MAVYKNIILEKSERIATLTFNLPEKRNPISEPEILEDILHALTDVQRDTTLSALIVTGAGAAFSSGGDIKAMRDRAGTFGGSPMDVAESYIAGIQQIPLAIYNLDIPSIAAVNGPAMGAGCDLTFMCDFRIASTTAQFGEVFINLGIIPGDAGSWFLPRRIPYQLAAEMTFTGRVVGAEEAFAKGMVMKLVEPAQLMDEALALARTIASKPPRTVRQAKRLLRNGERMDLPSFLNLAAANQALAHHTSDHIEAVTAFIEKRKPKFEGR